MGALTEDEIFDCLAENFRLAAESCETLATNPRKGPTYRKFLAEIELIEGACRQAGYWRQDTRWMALGMQMKGIHERAGDWLRGIKMPNGHRVKIAAGHQHPLFQKLAEILRQHAADGETYRTQRTGKLGKIMPDVPDAETRTQGRQMQVMLPDGMAMSRGGIIVPDHVTVQ